MTHYITDDIFVSDLTDHIEQKRHIQFLKALSPWQLELHEGMWDQFEKIVRLQCEEKGGRLSKRAENIIITHGLAKSELERRSMIVMRSKL